MPKHPRLSRRGTVYQVRAKVPADIRSTYGKTEEGWSLKTRDPQEALERVRLASVEIDQRFAAHRRKIRGHEITRLDLERIANVAYREQLALFDRHIDASKGSKDQNEAGLMANSSDLEDGLKNDWWYPEVDAQVTEILKANGIRLEPNDPLDLETYQLGRRLIARALLAANRVAHGHLQGDYTYEDGDTKVTVAKPDQASLPFAAIFEKYLQDRPLSRGALIEWRSNVDRFVKLVGDKPITSITRANIRTYRDGLLKLPGRGRKGTLAPATVTKALGSIGAVLNWAEANDYADMVPNWSNPAGSVKVSKQPRSGAKRLAFDDADLQLLFSSPIWTGCRSEIHRKEPGNMVIRDHHYWLPVLALYMGARLEELGQCLVSDVKQERGIHYLDLNGDGPDKSLKTASSWRKVPIHRVLKRLGFLEYAEALKAAGEKRLFPKLKQDPMGNWTSNYSHAFGLYKRAMGITDPKKVYHSFRHTFKEACRRAGVAEEVHDALTGHSGGGVGRTYGSMPLEAMAEAVDKVEYQTGL